MGSDSFSLLYADKTYIGRQEIEKIFKCSLMLTEQIILPSHAQLSPSLSDQDRDLVAFQLEQLAEVGAISLWDLPSVQTGSRETYSLGHVLEEPSRIDVSSNYHDIYDEMTQAANDYTQQGIFEDHRRGTETTLEGITEIVDYRQNMWSMLLADSLGADQVLARNQVPNSLSRHGRRLSQPQFETDVLSEFLHLQGLDSLHEDLGYWEIKAARKHLSDFREEFFYPVLQQATSSVESDPVEQLDVSELANEMNQEYTKRLESNVPTKRGLVFNLISTIVGFEIPWASIFPAIKEGRNYRRRKSELAPVILVMKLRNKNK